MAKTKVYLAKSNRSDPTLVGEVRFILNEDPNIEVREFSGGKYTNKLL